MLPVALRHRLGLRAGDEVRISEEAEGVLRLESRRAAARSLVGSAGLAEHPIVEELRADRRAQADAEDQDARRGPD